MNPLVIVLPPDEPTNVETPEYAGPAYVLTMLVPVSQVGEIDRNDALRREVTAAIAAAFPPPETPGV